MDRPEARDPVTGDRRAGGGGRALPGPGAATVGLLGPDLLSPGLRSGLRSGLPVSAENEIRS